MFDKKDTEVYEVEHRNPMDLASKDEFVSL